MKWRIYATMNEYSFIVQKILKKTCSNGVVLSETNWSHYDH
jgi:hypothetical protein